MQSISETCRGTTRKSAKEGTLIWDHRDLNYEERLKTRGLATLKRSSSSEENLISTGKDRAQWERFFESASIRTTRDRVINYLGKAIRTEIA